jgi:hypothetical protein
VLRGSGTGSLIAQDSPHRGHPSIVTPAVNTQASAIYGELGTLVHTEGRPTGTSWTYLVADEIAESGLGRLNNHLRIRTPNVGRAYAQEVDKETEQAFTGHEVSVPPAWPGRNDPSPGP